MIAAAVIGTTIYSATAGKDNKAARVAMKRLSWGLAVEVQSPFA